jgi:uncharacterized membrane protein YccC
MCSIAVFCGAITGHHNLLAVVIAAAWAFTAGMLVCLGTVAADIGAISLVTLIVYAAQPLTPRQAAESALLALAGAILQIVLSFASWPVRRYEPQRRALASLFLELAGAARRLPAGYAAPTATSAATRAQTAITSLASDNSVENLRYRSILTQAERIRVSLLLLIRLRIRMERERSDHPALAILDRYLEEASVTLRAVAESLRNGGPLSDKSDRISHAVAYSFELRQLCEPGGLSSFFTATLRDVQFQMDALTGQLRSSADLVSHASQEGSRAFHLREMQLPLHLRFGGNLATLRANLNLRSAAFRHAVRLAAAVAIGEALGRSFDWRRSYWLPMTVVVVLKPEFTTTFSRGILRIAGTIAGLLVTTAVLYFFPGNMIDEIVLIAVFMFFMRWAGPANYGILATAVSAMIVLLLAVYGVPAEQAIWARGINSAAGGALGLIAYAAWPTWERARTGDVLIALLRAYREYFTAVERRYGRQEDMPPQQLDRARQNARTARSNMEASLERLSAEPGVTDAQISRLNAILASSHRFAHAVMALEAGLPVTPLLPARPELLVLVDGVEKTFELLEAMLSGEHIPVKDFPDLRQAHNRLLQEGDPSAARYALVNVETDRITNSLNSLREQVSLWIQESLPRSAKESFD